MVNPQHIKAKAGDVAKKVVVSGDPARVKQLSLQLENSRLVNENRGFLTYTGRYRGEEFTIACHGVGAPSAAVVIEELVMLGAKAIVRLGSCGGLLKEMKIGDLVIPTGAAYIGGTLNQYLKGDHISPVPDFELTRQLIDTSSDLGIKHFVGPVFSSDAFHAEDPDFVARWTHRGYIAVEMECATLFGLAMMRGIKAGSLLLVSDNLAEMQPMVDAEGLKKHVEISSKVVFESLLRYKV